MRFQIPSCFSFNVSQSLYFDNSISSGCTSLHSFTQKSLYESLPYLPIPYNSIGYFQFFNKKSAVDKIFVFSDANKKKNILIYYIYL